MGQQCLDGGGKDGKERGQGKEEERRKERREGRERRTYDIGIREKIWVDGRFVFEDV